MPGAAKLCEDCCSHVPNKVEQTVRYYGYYGNVSRGKRRQENQDELISCILEPHGFSKEWRKSWARLIQKIYEVDPLTCLKCSGEMKVISVIDDEEIIKKILKHLGLWKIKERPPPTGPPKSPGYSIDYSDYQLPCLPDEAYGEARSDNLSRFSRSSEWLKGLLFPQCYLKF